MLGVVYDGWTWWVWSTFAPEVGVVEEAVGGVRMKMSGRV